MTCLKTDLHCHLSQVPSQVSHQEFWQRYFYKVHQLELDEARKQALMRRADNAQVKEESISWDDGKTFELLGDKSNYLGFAPNEYSDQYGFLPNSLKIMERKAL